MSYLVLARKYRPRQFGDLVGQEHVARTLANAIALDRVHHAFLFTGARGVGKTSAARILAMALSCEKGPTDKPCGACDICREIVGGQSVDVLEIDGASNTGVDDVRILREGVRYAPARARKKVYIIDEVHMLSTSAFNALLKTLEEPPAHVVFILATTEAHKIPATIMSRVQRYDFKLISSARLHEHLGHILRTESVAHDDDALKVVARQAAGSVRDALSLLDQVIAFVGSETITAARVADVLGLADRGLLLALVRAIIARNPGEALRALAQAIDRGVDLAQIARNLQAMLHDVELCGLLDDPGQVLDMTSDEIAEARALHAGAPRGLFQTLFDRWSRAVEEGARAPAPRLVYEMALVDLCFAEPLLPLGDLITRLEGLEARLASGGGAAGGGAGGARPSAPAARTGGRATPALSGAGEAPVASAPSAERVVSARSAAEPEAAAPRGAPAPRRSSPPPLPRASIDDATAFWRTVKEASVGVSPMLAAALEHAHVESLGPGAITLSLAEKFMVEQLEKARVRLEGLLAEVAGQPLRVSLKQGQGASPPVVVAAAALDAQHEAEERRRREEEARRHPMIQKAQDLFGARVTAVRT